MRRNVQTPDGVDWSVHRGAPRLRRPKDSEVISEGDEQGSFLTLLSSGFVAVVALLTPVLLLSGLWPLVVAWPVLAVLVWVLYWAWWPVAIERKGEPRNTGYVQGLWLANKITGDFADEIRATDDALLNN